MVGNGSLCQYCDASLPSTPQIKIGQMTKEEYLATTNIQSVEQAGHYLLQLRILFSLVFINAIVIQILERTNFQTAYTVCLVYALTVLVYFVYFCRKVIHAEKNTNASVFFCILFAPISWFWLYPSLVNPLKIIMGKMSPPDHPPAAKQHLSEADIAQYKKDFDKRVSRRVWKTVAIAFCIALALPFLFIWFFSV